MPGGGSAASQRGLRATALASSWWNHPRGRRCYMGSPIRANRPEPVAQPPQAGCSQVRPAHQGPVWTCLRIGRRQGNNANRRHILTTPSHSRLFCTDSSCTNYPCILRGELPQSQKLRAPAACRQPKSSRSRGGWSAFDGRFTTPRRTSVLAHPSWAATLHDIPPTAKDWNDRAGTHNPRPNRGRLYYSAHSNLASACHGYACVAMRNIVAEDMLMRA